MVSQAARGQKATFFVIGSNVLQNTDMLKRIVQEGHQIGSHTWSHTALPSLSFGQIVSGNLEPLSSESFFLKIVQSELVWTSKIIRDVTGVAPIIVRSPFGDTDEKVRQVASALNMTLVKWNRETNDWKFNAWTPGKTVDAPFKPSDTPDAIHQLFVDWTSQPKNGSISLQHDKSPEPVKQALPSIDTVMKAGYQFKTVADCIGQSAYSEVMLRRLNVSYQPAAAASIAKSGAMIAEPLSFSLLFAILALL